MRKCVGFVGSAPAMKLPGECGDLGAVDLLARLDQVHEKQEWWLRNRFVKADGVCSCSRMDRRRTTTCAYERRAPQPAPAATPEILESMGNSWRCARSRDRRSLARASTALSALRETGIQCDPDSHMRRLHRSTVRCL